MNSAQQPQPVKLPTYWVCSEGIPVDCHDHYETALRMADSYTRRTRSLHTVEASK